MIRDKIVKYADFLSFGTNDITQLVFGYSYEDTQTSFLEHYQRNTVTGNLSFQSIDVDGVSKLIDMVLYNVRGEKPGIIAGITSEHDGDPASIKFCNNIGIDYLSCSPYRLPITRLADAHTLIHGKKE